MSSRVERKETVEEGTASAARALVRRALETCARRCGAGDVRTLELLREGNGEALGYFRYSLAREAAAYAAQQDATLQDVYVVELDGGEGEPGATAFITVIAVVREVTAATSSLWAWISEGVTAEYKALLDVPEVAEMGSLLDVHLVAEAEVAQRTGMAALIGSLHTPALSVWQRG